MHNKIQKTGISAVKKAGKLALQEYKKFHRSQVNLKFGREIVLTIWNHDKYYLC